ncbi:transposase [uncultured Methanospirillum sp.]|uniref:IS66 family transposase n=1 Tax=uncultured Methanospirillum sp. TaxID=262503 RepID=UPI003749BA95
MGEKRGRKKKTFARNLLKRLELHKEGDLRFIENQIVPFANNLAERDIRMACTGDYTGS